MLDPTMRVFDKTTFEAERLMYWPSRSSDSQWVCEATEDGDRISVDDTLALRGLARRAAVACMPR